MTPRFRVLTPAARRVPAVIEREIGDGDHNHVRISLTGFHRRGARKPTLRTDEALLPAKPDKPQFRDYPVIGHAADMPKLTQMTKADCRTP